MRNDASIAAGERLFRFRPEDLPTYTILLPLFKEPRMVEQLVTGIAALNYPANRLDVKLLLEEDDVETQQAVLEADLPPYFEVVVVEDVGPRGKPRACNAGLARAKGEFLVIYDAEDRPERDQLLKAVCVFTQAPLDVMCLQAKLNYFNRTHNVLTRWFTAEYSVWFDQLLPGLQAADVAIPLGGTSNHFITAALKNLGGWDPYNVTEDAELGLRIYLRGWKTAVLDTTTYEEATSRCGNWIRQRSRWVKGYMQTWLAYMRHPVTMARQMGPKAFVVFNLFFGGCTICLLINPIYWLLTALWFMTRFHWIESVFPAPVLYVGLIGLFIGNAVTVLFIAAGAFARRNYDDVKWAFLAPFYWLLMSLAAYKALAQLFVKPSYWEKTEHGFCAYDDAAIEPVRREMVPHLRAVD
jgi:cellulose synthase/poly-beta-1,6-N-acetylglucosamine synthase-like glycosyltransferase